MLKINKKGFTLIELMVVIAIIAILATVVLVSLQSARDRAQDTNKISSVTQIRSLAEVYYSKDLDYSGLITPAEELSEIFDTYCDDTSCAQAGDEYGGTGELVLHVNGDNSAYCAEITLENGYFCVDGPGLKAINSDGTCSASTFACTAE